MNLLAEWLPLFGLLAAASAYPMFQDRIPNGHNVPHPCQANTIWQGVGHKNPNGGGERNVFGLAFNASGFTWTYDLCTADTDQDGMTNGQELGDPNCTWSPGMAVTRTYNISHPGICDPYNSPACLARNSFLSCTKDGIQACQSITNNTNVSSIDLRFSPTRVPNSETNYYCMTFDLPNDQAYHIAANEPIIANKDLVHHMLLFGCKSPEDAYMPVPQSCGMSANGKCGSIIGTWTVGTTGSCFKDNVGFRIGNTGFTRVKLQIHYNNPFLIQNYSDTSGMRLYYKPVQPGDQDLAMLMTGQLLLQIPPRQSYVETIGICPADCTSMILTQPVNVTSVFNHMHYLGTSMTVEVFRDGMKLQTLSDDEHYSYDSPVTHNLDPEFELRPGDEIKTSCVYNTLSTSRYTYYGEATSDEMCFGFITMYPKQAVLTDSCNSFSSSSMCDIQLGKPMGQCDWVKFINFSDPDTAKIVNDVTKNCNLDGFCRPECRTVLKSLQNHPCLQGDQNMWVTYLLSRGQPDSLNFLGRLRTCPVEESCNNQCPDCGEYGNGAPRIVLASALLVFMSACAWLVYGPQ